MPDISQIRLVDGVIYTFKDAVARSAQAGGMHFVGVTTTEILDETAAATVVIAGENHASSPGDIVLYGYKEFVYGTDNLWHEFGDNSGLGALATKDTARTTYTPVGTVSQPIFNGDAMTSTGTYTPRGTITQPIFSGTEVNISVSGTPSGSITATANNNGNYQPAGSVAAPTISLQTAGSTTTVNSITSVGTLPTLNTTVENEVLIFNFNQGALPVKGADTVVKTGDGVYQASAPAFTGTKVQMNFVGNPLSSTGTFTPEGDVSQPEFNGTQETLSVSGTPEGTVSQPTFTGTQATITVS